LNTTIEYWQHLGMLAVGLVTLGGLCWLIYKGFELWDELDHREEGEDG